MALLDDVCSGRFVPAFPLKISDDAGSYVQAGGLTKREYFAGLAMQGILGNPERYMEASEIAVESVDLADALLAELAKPAAPAFKVGDHVIDQGGVPCVVVATDAAPCYLVAYADGGEIRRPISSLAPAPTSSTEPRA